MEEVFGKKKRVYKKRVYKKKTIKKEIIEKKPVKKKRIKKGTGVYYAIYVGKHKHISYTGIGRVIPGKEYPINKKLANSLSSSKNWNVREGYVYADIV